MLNEKEIDKIAEFIISNYFFKDKEKVREIVKQHINYGTLAVEYEQDDIVAVARWNVTNDTAYILDLVIRKDHRNKGFIKMMLRKGMKVWKDVKYISFIRGIKYPDRERKKYSLIKFLGGDYGK